MKNVQKMYSLFVWYIFKTATINMVSKHTLIQISLYPWLTGKYILPYLSKQVFLLKFNAKKGGTILSPSTFQSGEGNCPQLFRP
jgi:ABC-type antimicrobial peptide transport system permease subunit